MGQLVEWVQETGGSKIYLMKAWTTSENTKCPAKTYKATSLPAGVAQASCGTAANTSACREVQVDTSVERDFKVTFTVTADGATDKLVVVSLKV